MWAEYYATLKSQKSAQFVMAQKPNSERITTKLAYVFGLHKDKSNPFRDLEASNHYNVAINLLMPLQNGSQNETTIAAFESHTCLYRQLRNGPTTSYMMRPSKILPSPGIN